MISVTPIVEGLIVDEERKINNKSETKLQKFSIFFHLKFIAIGRIDVEGIYLLYKFINL